MPKILLIEGHADLIPEVTGTLQEAGFDVVQTADSKACLDIARQEMPDSIVLSAELPKGSGYGICGKIKKDGDLHAIPVLLTSPDATEKAFGDHSRLKTGRADEYLLYRPYDANQLLEKVGALIGLPEPLTLEPIEEAPPQEEAPALEEVEPAHPAEDAPALEPVEDLPMSAEELAALDGAFEGTERNVKVPAEPAEAPSPAAHAAPPPTAADGAEVERLRSELLAHEKELAELRESLAAKDQELVQEREKAAASSSSQQIKLEEEYKGDPKFKPFQQKIDALVALQKRAERDLNTARDEARQATGKLKVTEEELAAARALATEHEATGKRLTGELETATRRLSDLEAELVTARPRAAAADEAEATAKRLGGELETATAKIAELEGQLAAETSRADEAAAELKGTRVQLEEAQETIEGLQRRIAELDAASQTLKDRVKKSLTFAQQLLEGAEQSESEAPRD